MYTTVIDAAMKEETEQHQMCLFSSLIDDCHKLSILAHLSGNCLCAAKEKKMGLSL